MSNSRARGAGPIRLLVLAGLALAAIGGPVWAQHLATPQPKMVVTDYDMRKAATPPALSEVELTGKKLFVQRCALCHDLRGQPATTTVGPWIDREVVKARGDAAVRQKITQGSPRMPAWQYTLEPPQIDAVIAYLKTVSPDLRYKPGGAVAVPID
jgi:mono/diheme cytochrome c family protein